MNWIDAKTKLPEAHADVLVWVRYKGNRHFYFTKGWRRKDTEHGYKCRYSKCNWALGSASGYRVTHWMYVEEPNN